MWGTEEDVDRIVRAQMKVLRAKHKAEIEKLKAKLAKALERAARAEDDASRLRFPDTSGGQGLDSDFTTGEMGQ